MFNELTLALHILLLVTVYLFLFVVVRTIARDVSVRQRPGAQGVILSERPGESVPRLTMNQPGATGNSIVYPINDELVIGRSEDCDIELDDTFISAHHARIYRTGSDYWLEDLDSTNGTLFEGKPIDGPLRMANGDEFGIAENIFRFVE